jgi:hypothetical protein
MRLFHNDLACPLASIIVSRACDFPGWLLLLYSTAIRPGKPSNLLKRHPYRLGLAQVRGVPTVTGITSLTSTVNR